MKGSYKGCDVVVWTDELSTEISIDRLGIEVELPPLERDRAFQLARLLIDWALREAADSREATAA